jgi:hypothetical protein
VPWAAPKKGVDAARIMELRGIEVSWRSIAGDVDSGIGRRYIRLYGVPRSRARVDSAHEQCFDQRDVGFVMFGCSRDVVLKSYMVFSRQPMSFLYELGLEI